MNITKTNETNATAQFLATFLFRLVHPPWNVDYFFSLVVVIYCAYSLSLSPSLRCMSFTLCLFCLFVNASKNKTKINLNRVLELSTNC